MCKVGDIKVSVIIPTRNRAKHLERAVMALREQVDAPPFEVLVVDNGSTDDTGRLLAEWSRAWPGWIRALESDRQGPGATRNVGIRQALGEFIAMVDDDCIPEPEWLCNIIKGYDENESLAGIGGQTFPVDASSVFSRYQDLFSLHQPHRDETGITFLITNNASYRADRLLETGGFDETHFMAAEDVDISRRLRARGYVLGYQPEAKVRHHNITTLYGYLRMCYRYGQGMALLHRKHPAWYKILRTLWWSRHLLSWVWMPLRATRLRKEKLTGWVDSFVFAALGSGQDMIGFIGSMSQMRHIIRGEK